MIGQTVGDYRITAKLGEGGFGVVYKGVHRLSEQEVAIKTIDSVLTLDPKFRDRFFAEARIQARLKHPHIVVMHNFFEHDGRYYIVLEYMEGAEFSGGQRVRTLAELVRLGPVPEERLVELFRPVLDAVGYAHGLGILHRDIKPLNMLFAESGILKVADFGIAKMVGGETSVSVSGARVGTPAYMSPEQVFDKRLTRMTDIYSLGCTLYEAATGCLPFRESDTSSLLEAHVSEPPLPPRQRNPAISVELEQVILKAMQKKPEERFQSCEEFAAALGRTGAAPRPRPAGIRVPALVGRSREVAEELVTCLGLRFEAEEEYSESVPAGSVVAQQPEAGTETAAGQIVRVRLSRGRRPAEPGVYRTIPEPPSVVAPQPATGIQRSKPGAPRPPDAAPPSELSTQRSPARRRAWIAAGVLLGIVAVVVAAFIVGGRRPAVSGERPAVGGMRSLGRNAQGYEEFLWLKDSSVMVRIPAGTFTMGSNDEGADERPVHQVYLDEFYIDKHEVTNRQYKKFCDATGRSYPADPGFTGMSDYFTRYPSYPVVNVSWEDAKAYCDWAGKRLPTEAEWEKAARGTDARKYPWGNSEPTGSRCNFADRNTDFGWSDENADDGYARTSPVGSFPSGASPYGCLDMAGNVWEWCNDWYDSEYYGRSANNDPPGPSTGSFRVSRGGSWNCYAGYLRCAGRNWGGPSFRYVTLGFRSSRSGE